MKLPILFISLIYLEILLISFALFSITKKMYKIIIDNDVINEKAVL